MNKKDIELLKAYFSEHFINEFDVQGNGGCDTCGYGGDEAMSLEKIRDVLDKFLDSKMFQENKQ